MLRACFPFLKRKQSGFTLLELVFSVMILGLLSLALSPAFRTLVSSRDIAYLNEQTAINQKIAAAMLTYAEYEPVPTGTLTPPCSHQSSKTFFSIYNPTRCPDTQGLRDYLQQQGVSLSQANDDGKAGKNLRVFQLLPAETQLTYLNHQSGPLVYLNYDYGVLYLTNCRQSQPCNQSLASSSTPPKSQPTLPGDLAATAGAAPLTSGNRSTWIPGTRDIGVTYVSTLPLQKKMLQKTAEHLERIRLALSNYYAGQQAASPTSTANFYPQPSDPGQHRPPDYDFVANQGCHEGWYALDSEIIDILKIVGIGGGTIEAGRTAWGGTIEYCRDYDATGTAAYGAPPHYAALRINRALSFSLPPVETKYGDDPANNIVISF